MLKANFNKKAMKSIIAHSEILSHIIEVECGELLDLCFYRGKLQLRLIEKSIFFNKGNCAMKKVSNSDYLMSQNRVINGYPMSYDQFERIVIR